MEIKGALMQLFSPSDRIDQILFDITHHTLNSDTVEHGHTCIEIVLVVSGTAVQVIDGKRVHVYPGCVSIIHPGGSHAFQEPKKCELYNISCTPNVFRAMEVHLSFLHNREELFLSESGSFFLRLEGSLFQDVRNLLLHMFRAYKNNALPERHVQLRSLFSMLLILLAQTWAPKTACPGGNRLAETADYMNVHYNEKLTLDHLARRIGMSKNQFLRKFRREFKTSPIQYLLELRMKHACVLLEESDLSIDQIASSTGFCDGNNFIKLYRKRFRRPPGKSRKQLSEPSRHVC